MTNQQSNSQKESKQGLVNQWSDKPTDASPSTLKVLGIVAGILAALSILFFVIFPGAFIIVAMALFDNPNNFKLPYNGIDFQKIAYIDNQFVMYGIDYDKSGLKQLVIFNSTDGKQWDKSTIEITSENREAAILPSGTFNYFKGKCYLFGATTQPLVAPDCTHWQTQNINQINNNNYYLGTAHSSAVANGVLYVGGDGGVYKTNNGVIWSREAVPYPKETKQRNFVNRFYSMAIGNNKLITTTKWGHNGKWIGLIHYKNLVTNKWSYETYPVPVSNIIYGKDRFVGFATKNALVLMDDSNKWESYNVKFNASNFIYNSNDEFMGVSDYASIERSRNGVNWGYFKSVIDSEKYVISLACSKTACVAVGSNYYIISTSNNTEFKIEEFNHKNSWVGKLLKIFY